LDGLDAVWREPPKELPAQRAAPWPEKPWAENQLARISLRRIEIREPIQFFYDTYEVRPSSRSTLGAVARILRDKPQITHVVIEGHASEEGSHRYNYELSIQRAQAILRALVEAGVHPDRLSCRGLGEVSPQALGSDEASLSHNRRVVFSIVKQLDPLEPIPEQAPRVIPWAPVVPAPPAAEDDVSEDPSVENE